MKVPGDHLAIYLKDHHAGSEAALGILDHIEATHAGGAAARMSEKLRPEFLQEREQLTRLLALLDDSSSVPRRFASWLSEKTMELKLKADDSADGALHLLEAVELLGLGVHGKLGLWVALSANRQLVPALANVEYEPLIRQAEAQRELIESVRLEAARTLIAELASFSRAADH